MPGFTGFVAILFSFNCQRRDYIFCCILCQSVEGKVFKKCNSSARAYAAPRGRLTVESRKNLYRAY